MYSEGLIFFLILALFVWLGVITWFLIKVNLNFKKVFPSGRNGNFKEQLIEVLTKIKELDEVKDQSLSDLSRSGLIRYNPYNDTGGDQSFSLSLLNRKGDGVVITSLHSRSSTRVFAKSVISGKSDKHEFSEEEVEAVKKALHE